jgi:hypothetical protein
LRKDWRDLADSVMRHGLFVPSPSEGELVTGLRTLGGGPLPRGTSANAVAEPLIRGRGGLWFGGKTKNDSLKPPPAPSFRRRGGKSFSARCSLPFSRGGSGWGLIYESSSVFNSARTKDVLMGSKHSRLPLAPSLGRRGTGIENPAFVGWSRRIS